MACVKSRSDLIIILYIKAARIFIAFKLWNHKLFMQWNFMRTRNNYSNRVTLWALSYYSISFCERMIWHFAETGSIVACKSITNIFKNTKLIAAMDEGRAGLLGWTKLLYISWYLVFCSHGLIDKFVGKYRVTNHLVLTFINTPLIGPNPLKWITEKPTKCKN